ncbi:bifunctional 4-hydroxy-2-oxoglutarate aldolase/2-dehydro-3-deoxy-phosphogluconate aldolase [Caulobacter sp. 17J80-11]|uniref:bifunctional 4-hydroxy-2-oxoglutarate aldolase/2-dehydro-3-deoxy-phosphogluconate aldolase n=1 Tax=Caulobacter sp. 17J80-11 TaxID=2763502 RepID=UPI00351C0BD5
MQLDEIMTLSPVIAVVTIRDAAHAEPLTRALVAGGIRAVEITLRTPAALDSIRAAAKVEGAVVGSGTCLTAADLKASADAGAVFAVSPGATTPLLQAGLKSAIPLLPGIATASELMAGLEQGYTRFKLFPAEAAGGAALLKGLSGPLPQAKFCPTGGVNIENAARYLALPNVQCVGGSWLAPDELMDAGDWGRVQELARTAVAKLGR